VSWSSAQFPPRRGLSADSRRPGQPRMRPAFGGGLTWRIGFVLHASPLRGLGVPARLLPSLVEIGFVLHIWPPAPARGGPKLGSFRTFHSPAETRPTPHLPFPTYPSHPKFGFVLHNSLRHPPPAGGNWVRFAHFTPWPSHAPHGNCLCPHNPVAPSLASFRTFFLRDTPPGGPNWLRFAHLPSGRTELGSFCTFRPHAVNCLSTADERR
jgi:hypothetical protein